jgi:hypothetical protein
MVFKKINSNRVCSIVFVSMKRREFKTQLKYAKAQEELVGEFKAVKSFKGVLTNKRDGWTD